MVRVIILYPHKPGGRFDHRYYAEKHVPMVWKALAPLGLVSIESGRVLPGSDPASPPPYVAAAHLVFESEAAYHKAFDAKVDELANDLPNYTDIQPLVLVTEVTAQVS